MLKQSFHISRSDPINDYGPAYVFPDSVISPDGFKTDFNFDRKGRLTSIMDKSGIVDSFEYDIYGRLTEYRKGVPNDLILVGKYQYNDFTRGARKISFNSDAPGDYDAIDYSYDGLGRLINEERNPPNSVVVDYIYNGNGQVIKQTQPRFDNISLYDADFTIKTFDGLGRVTEIEYPKSSSESGLEIVEYFFDGYITDVVDEMEDTTTLINDASGNLIEVIDALGFYTDYYYDVNGNLDSIIDAEEKKSSFEYDWLGNLVKREGPDRGVDTFAYNANGNTKYHKNNAGDEIEFFYDELGRITQKEVNNQVKETYYYDDYDNIGGDTYNPHDSLDYPEGRLTGFQNSNVKEVYFYDKFSNLGQKLAILSTEESIDTFKYSYDLKGRLTELEYPDDNFKVEYEYDKLGNISSVEINDGETVTLSSTAAGLLSGVHFPGGVTDTFTYLPRNWMDSMKINVIPDPYSRGFEYNKRGELIREKRADDYIAYYGYDALGRIILDSRYQEGSYYHNYVYDKVGNRIEMDYGNIEYDYEPGTNKLIYDGFNEYGYNDIGCISSKTNLDGTTEFFYNPEGRLIGVSDEDNNGYRYYYKGLQRIREEELENITGVAGGFTYSCDVKSAGLTGGILEAVFLNDNNNEIGTLLLEEISGTNDWITLSGDISENEFLPGTFTVKLRVRKESGSSGSLWVGDMNMDVETEQSGNIIQSSNYFYDNAGNLILVNSLGKTESTNAVKNPGFETGDLSDWSEYFPAFTYGWVTDGYGSYSPYEGEYFLLTWGLDESYIYQEIPISEEVSSPITISCWVKSNLIREGGFVIKGVLKGDGINEEHCSDTLTESCDWTKWSLTIDNIPEGTSSCEIILMRMDGYSTVAIDNVVCELETEQMTETKYIYAGNRLLAKEEDEELHFYHLDRLGSPIMITDESGAVVKEKQYEAFGNLIWSEGTLEDNREFTGKEKDPTGFHYFGARYYYGDIGRFLTPDPLTINPKNLKLANSQGHNPYVYCLNNPLSFVDLFGLEGENLIEYWEQKNRENRMKETWTSGGSYAIFGNSGVPGFIINLGQEEIAALKGLAMEKLENGKGYIDINVTHNIFTPYTLATEGLLATPEGIRLVIGFGLGGAVEVNLEQLGALGGSVSLHVSGDKVTTGWHVAVQGSFSKYSAQAGIKSQGFVPFTEVGVTGRAWWSKVGTEISLTAFYVTDLIYKWNKPLK